jgi:hypothetical protein
LEENASSAPDNNKVSVGSKVIVNEPVQGSTGLPLGVKPDAVKSYVSVTVAALARPITPNTSVKMTASIVRAVLVMITLPYATARTVTIYACSCARDRENSQASQTDQKRVCGLQRPPMALFTARSTSPRLRLALDKGSLCKIYTTLIAA